jgi:hypothetical protein
VPGAASRVVPSAWEYAREGFNFGSGGSWVAAGQGFDFRTGGSRDLNLVARGRKIRGARWQRELVGPTW